MNRTNAELIVGGLAVAGAAFLLYQGRHYLIDSYRELTYKQGEMKYFTINELTYSSTAVARGIDNTPNAEQEQNLRALCISMLDKIREKYGKPIKVSSGFRSPALNKAVGGASNSQHLTGMAADLVPANGFGSVDEIFNAARAVGGYDQLIIEENSKGSRWVHVSYNAKGGQRGEVLAYKNGKYTRIA